MKLALAAAALLVVACVPSEGPLMEPGRDCLGCHGAGEAKRWTVAGTWPPQGSRVAIADAAGKSFTLTTNQVGNFYSAEPVTFPLTVSVDGKTMPNPVTYGGCNRCHGPYATEGPLMRPGQDCLHCHDGTKATPKFTAAGTFAPLTKYPRGSTVTIPGVGGTITLTTNLAGNFYTDQPIAFPVTPMVNSNAMPSPAPNGRCNTCHKLDGTAENYGPLMRPGDDCLACHDGSQATLFYAAGTFPPSGGFAVGSTVTITAGGKTVSATTNAVGNFYITAPLTLPGTASVNGSRMQPALDYGGCNRCHVNGQASG